MSPGDVPVTVHQTGVRWVLKCSTPGCQTRLDLDLEHIGADQVAEFLESRVAVHLRCIAIELGWTEEDECPGCRKRRRLMEIGVDPVLDSLGEYIDSVKVDRFPAAPDVEDLNSDPREWTGSSVPRAQRDKWNGEPK
jgi:hypothetical protein